MESSFVIYNNFEQTLSDCGEYVTQVSGTSMFPMLRYRRDPVLIHQVSDELKRYDVAVYNRGDSYVIHRILEVRPDCYVFRGDNCIAKELIPRQFVVGVVDGFWRVPRKGGTGRFVSVHNPLYRIYSRLWVALNPMNVQMVSYFTRFNRALCNFIAFFAIILGVTACSIVEKREIITAADLPVAAQQVLQENFPGQDASYVLKETEWLVKVNYDVRLESGAEIDFDADGQWEKVDCKLFPVPEGILPAEILTQVNQKFPGAFVTEIDKDFWGYDVELDNHLDIKFNRKFNMSLDD